MRKSRWRRQQQRDGAGIRARSTGPHPRGEAGRTLPDGAKLSLAYGPQDLPVHALDALGGEWTFERDARGRLVERKDPLGRVTRFHYHAQWLVGLTDPAGGYTGAGYDPRGNLDAASTG